MNWILEQCPEEEAVARVESQFKLPDDDDSSKQLEVSITVFDSRIVGTTGTEKDWSTTYYDKSSFHMHAPVVGRGERG